MNSLGVIIARMQPIHNGHLALIKKAASECDGVLILLGSANKFNERNPIPIALRKTLVETAVKDAGIQTTVKVVALDDLTDESDNSHDWGFYLYHAMVKNNPFTFNNFTIYYSDGFEIITSWFPSFLLKESVSLSLIARGSCEEGISATKVRECILREHDDELKKLVPPNVFDLRQALRSQIQFAKSLDKNN